MSEEKSNKAHAAAPATEEDVNTTPPNPPAPADGKSEWQMPEPVFRKTSGYLPQGFEKKYSQAEIKANADDSVSTAAMPRPEPVDIEPQPEIHDTAEGPDGPADAAAPPAAAKKSGALRLALMIVGLLVALGLIAAFIAVVYVLFLSPSANGNF